VAIEDRQAILEDRKRLIEESCASCGVENFSCFGTSIWDETLYKAWSEIVTNLIPNIAILETHLNKFCKHCDADEVVLFERATFLVISHALAGEQAGGGGGAGTTLGLEDPMDQNNDPDALASSPRLTTTTEESSENNIVSSSPAQQGQQQPPSHIVDRGAGGGDWHSQQTPRHMSRTPHFDAHRFEKISNIVKQFKLSCGKAQSQFQGMQVRNSRFSAFIDAFTANTYIMVIVSNPQVHTAATLLNIQNARTHFERFIPRI
jgi:hypothetical protein